MCIIIIKQKPNHLPSEVLKNSARINRDGLGILWLDTYKIEYKNSKDYQVLNTDRPFIAHFRYATIGKVSKEDIHPFRCGKHSDEYLFQNGTINGYGNKNMTDTEDLAQRLGRCPRHLWAKSLSKFNCRFVTANVRNKSFQIYNKKSWIHKDGVWYSKGNVFQNHLVAVYGTLKKGYGNNYLLSNQKYLGRGKTLSKYPLNTKGLPYLYNEKGVGHNVVVDVYQVSDANLKQLDRLEQHPHWYRRELTNIRLTKKVVVKCWVYFMIQNPRDKSLPMLESYIYSAPQVVQPTRYDYTPQTDMFSGLSEFEELNDCEIIEDNSTPYCSQCYKDLEFDSFNAYHCSSCGTWFSESEIESSNR